MTEVEPSRRERKKDETRERIARAALALFVEKGFAATTVDEIAQRADVAKGTFFNYFPRKEGVLAVVAHEHLLELHERTERLLSGPGGAIREKVIELFLGGAADLQENPDVWRHMYLEFFKGPVSALVEVDMRAQEAIRRVIERGQATGEFRADVPVERLSYVLRGTYFFTTLAWLYCPEMYDLRDELLRRLEVVFDGACPHKAAS